MKKLISIILCTIFLTTISMAQEPSTQSEVGENPAMEEQEFEDSGFLWVDPLYTQFEKMLPKIAASLGRLENRVSTLAFSQIIFSPDLDSSFRKIATSKIHGQLLAENPSLKLIKCDVCDQIQSKISGGVLKIQRGFGDLEGQRNLAKELKVQGFMQIAVLKNDRQLSVILNVRDAEEGRMVLADVITGTPLPELVHVNIFAGQMTIPIVLSSGTSVDENALFLAIEETVRFTESFVFNISATVYMDNNSNLTEGEYEEIQTGGMYDGTVGWEMFSLDDKNASFIVSLGIGQFLSTQLNFAPYGKFSAKLIVGQSLTFNAHYISFSKTTLTAEDSDSSSTSTSSYASGSALIMGLGYQF